MVSCQLHFLKGIEVFLQVTEEERDLPLVAGLQRCHVVQISD